MSCHCAKIDPKSLTIPAHGTREVRLTLNLQISIDRPDLTAQDFNVYIKPRVKNAPAPHSGWTIHGRVQKAFRVEPEGVDYEGRLVEGTRFHQRKVTITPLVPLQKVQAVCDPSEAAIGLKETKGEGYELSVCPKDRPAGPFSFAVAIQGITDKGSQIPVIKIPIVGRITEDVQAIPAMIVLGPCRLGDEMHATITLRSQCGQPFEIENMESQSRSTVVKPIGQSLPYEKLFRIDQQVAEKGNQSSTVKFRVRTKGDKVTTIKVLVNYLGMKM